MHGTRLARRRQTGTVAAAHAANGQFPAVIAFQQRAIAALDDARPTTRKRMQLRLAGYQHGQAWVDSENSFARPAE